MVSTEGGATERLINHSCIVIDFLLKGVSQTLNYAPLCVCVVQYFIESTKLSITGLNFPKLRLLLLPLQLLLLPLQLLHSECVVTTFKPFVHNHRNGKGFNYSCFVKRANAPLHF